MDALTLEEKTAQFEEFFMISHAVNINVTLLDTNTTIPKAEQLDKVMPPAFKMASELATIEAQALRPLRHLSDHASELAEYLTHQARKIDLMMSYILQQQDEENQRFETQKFGGGGVIVIHPAPLPIGAKAELKIFLSEEAAAIYCFGEVIACESNDNESLVSFSFSSIREQDQELLVRASLHLQTQQLRKRAQKKSNNAD